VNVPSKRVSLAGSFLRVSLVFVVFGVSAQAQQVEQRVTIAKGWHSWYEVKIDPEDSNNVVICGSKWDPLRNALYGFIYVSPDGGREWKTTFEDRETPWVSEHSCAFGQDHTVYFISEASRVIDGATHHELGTTRLFVSKDAGLHWTKTIETGWADYSTSAVSATTGNLVTFFNNAGTHDKGRGWGSTVAALMFSEAGTRIVGPYLEPTMKLRNYQGILPSQAVALTDGSVAVLYGGVRNTPDGPHYDLGFERIGPTLPVRVSDSIITTSSKECFRLDGHALAYDHSRKQLIAVFSDKSDSGGCRLHVAVSGDSGQTWASKPLANIPVGSGGALDHVAVASAGDGTFGVVWEDAGRWRFSILNNLSSFGPTVELTSSMVPERPTDDSLMTFVYQANGVQLNASGSSPVATINVRSMPGLVQRSIALCAAHGHYQVVLPVLRKEYEGLEVVTISSKSKPGPQASSVVPEISREEDVTTRVVLLNGRMQSFDTATGTLSIDLRLANRGDRPISLPIRIEANEISSNAGTVAVLNSNNGIHGPGAVWDISRTVTGSQLSPGSTTYNSFQLSFHVDLKPNSLPSDNFLNLKVRILASREPTPKDKPSSQR
jgi:hypothetical protein